MEDNPKLPGDLNKFETLVEIVARLRAPDGCPWDREQTHSSLRENFLQECYEVLNALDEGDTDELSQELGDLLMHILLQARIAAEAGEFKLEDVISGISTKMIRRHPHVFGSVKAENSGEVMANWQVLKREEKATDESVLSGVPNQLPALSYSEEIQHRVAHLGFDWKDIDGVIDKLAEEMTELKKAENDEQKAEEFGDLLFTLVNIARRMGIDSESALREANKKFFTRFSLMEGLCRQRGLTFAEMSFKEQNALWEEVKKSNLS
ncbi:nucleoside triphosphate pyrophosphohydrolase [Chloroflexota bacterium]